MIRGFRISLLLIACLILAAWLAAPSAASVGVGVDTGKIELNEALVPGGVYRLPAIGVVNTGDELTQYRVNITFMDNQSELKPETGWFTFSPDAFTLEKANSLRVSTTLRVPVNAPAGKYFALIEASPAVKPGGTATVGVAAAAKLSFNIREANLAMAVIHRTGDFFRDSSPYIYFALGVIAAIILIIVFRRHFRFSLKVEKKD
jgi:hypothetical protein